MTFLPFFDVQPGHSSTTSAVKKEYPREAQIERAFTKANPDVLARYERLLTVYGQVTPDFTACDITEHFEAKYGKLDEIERKALGGLYQRLMRSGVIRKTGAYRARNQGNVAVVYALIK